MRTPQEKSDTNLVKLIEQFGSDEKCREHLTQLRWPNGVRCPRCDGEKVSKIKDESKYDCSCGYQFTATSGTIFHDTHLPLWKWFLAIYLMTESKKGISACQMQRTISVSYKTAWYLCHRIRAAMKDSNAELLKGIVEVDETYVGGKVRGRGRGYRDNKAPVIGALERAGAARLNVLPFVDREMLHAFVHKHMAPEAEAIHTDEHPCYNGIADSDTRHEKVNHSAEEWVRGNIHTNGIENVWSLLKRSIIGSYHKVSVKHLDAYLDELEHRFNNRQNKYLFRDTLMKLVASKKLSYKALTAKAA